MRKKIYLCFILILSRIVTCPFLIEIKLLDFYAVVEVLFCEDITTEIPEGAVNRISCCRSPLLRGYNNTIQWLTLWLECCCRSPLLRGYNNIFFGRFCPRCSCRSPLLRGYNNTRTKSTKLFILISCRSPLLRGYNNFVVFAFQTNCWQL